MPSLIAIAAHPDDIEFLMAGTMLLLRERGWDLHYMNLANGSRGSMVTDQRETARIRLAEAQRAAESLGATFYPPIFDDMEIAYTTAAVQQVTAAVRQAQADVLLTHAPVDYMEDHEIACRLATSAAFSHSFPNFPSDPAVEPYAAPITVYHAQPHSNRTPMGERVQPHFAVDIESVIDAKEAVLACHASQKDWLDETQGMGSYLQTMRDLGADLAHSIGKYRIAEGWRRRQHWGFCGPDDDPLRTVLADLVSDVAPPGP